MKNKILFSTLEVASYTWNFYLVDAYHEKLRSLEKQRMNQIVLTDEQLENEEYEDSQFFTESMEVYISKDVTFERIQKFIMENIYLVFLFSYGVTISDMNEETQCDFHGSHLDDIISIWKTLCKDAKEALKN